MASTSSSIHPPSSIIRRTNTISDQPQTSFRPPSTINQQEDSETATTSSISTQASTSQNVDDDDSSFSTGRSSASQQPYRHDQCPPSGIEPGGRSGSLSDPAPSNPSGPNPSNGTTQSSPHETANCITRKGWKQFGNGWFIHGIALSMTVAIVVIGSLHFYWYPDNGPFMLNYRVDPDTISNVLQLAAKLHELLIVASLSSLALAMFRRSLVTRGVRLGLLTGGYRVGDLAYIGSAAFRSQGLNIYNPWGLLLPGFIVFATLMSTIVGPASAVLLVPTLGWYDIDTSVAFSNIKLPLIYSSTKRDVWSTELNDTKRACKGVDGIYLPYCPAGGYSEISSWLLDYAATDLTNNLTFHVPSADLRRHLIFTQANGTQNTSSTTLCTTPPHFLTASIGLLRKYIDGSNVGQLSREPRYRLQTTSISHDGSSPQDESILYQPFVQSKCTIHEKDKILNDTGNFYYPVDSLNCFDDDYCQKSQENQVRFDKTFLENTQDSTSVSSSFLLTRNISSVVYIHGQIPDTKLGERRNIVYLCSMHASWARSDFSLDASVSDALQSSFSHKPNMENLYHSKTFGHVKTFNFSHNWLNALNPNVYTTKNNTISAIDRLVQHFSFNDNKNGSKIPSMVVDQANNSAAEIFLSKVFGVYLTEGLARSTKPYESTQLEQSKDRDGYIELDKMYGRRSQKNKVPRNSDITTANNDKLHIHIAAQRHGYGSGQQRPTLVFAQAVMIIYLATIAIYALWIGLMNVLKGQRVLSVIPWSDLQDLILLALKTPVPEDPDLANAGTGAPSTDVWEKTVWAGADEEPRADTEPGAVEERSVKLIVGEKIEGDERCLNLNCEVKYY